MVFNGAGVGGGGGGDDAAAVVVVVYGGGCGGCDVGIGAVLSPSAGFGAVLLLRGFLQECRLSCF